MASQGSAERFEIIPLDANEKPITAATMSFGGWALPHEKPNFETEQRSKKTMYPGNPVATLQVYGPNFPNTIFVGEYHWRYTAINVVGSGFEAVDGGSAQATNSPPSVNASTQTTPEYIQEKLEALCISGQGVEVHWSGNIRKGILKKVNFQPKRREDIPYTLDFEWSQRSDQSAPPYVITPFPLDSSGEQSVHAANLASLVVAPDAVPDLLSSGATSLVEGIATAAADMAAAIVNLSLQSGTGTAAGPGNSPAALQQLAVRGVQDCGLIQQSCAALLDLLEPAASDAALVTQDPAQLIAYEVWRCGLIEEAIATNSDAYNSQMAFAASISQTAVTAYRAKGATDLRDVAVLFGQDASAWTEIANFNYLDDSALAAGQLVIIPQFTGQVPS
jgi:hypothetical protein